MKQRNQLLMLVSLHPNEEWNWTTLSEHKQISIEFVLEYQNATWNWSKLTENLSISNEDILANLTLPWDWDYLSYGQSCKRESYRRDITLDFIRKVNKTISPSPINWAILPYNRNNTWDFVKETLNFPWDWDALSYSLGWSVIIEHINDVDAQWKWTWLSRSHNLEWEFVHEHIDYPWDWHQLSINDRTTEKCVLEHMDYPWDWEQIVCKSSITWQFVAATLDKPWNWSMLSWRLIFDDDSVDFAIQFQDRWNYDSISATYGTSFAVVEALIHKPWNWEALSDNRYLTYDIVAKYVDKPWNMMRVFNSISNSTAYTPRQKRIIYKFYNKIRAPMLQRKRLHQYCMLAIRMKPEVGVDYFAIKDEVMALSNN